MSVIAFQTDSVPEDVTCSNEWRIIKISGLLDFSLIGIIADITGILKEKKIPVLTISTFDTDYILVKDKDLSTGIEVLKEKGYDILKENMNTI